MLCICEKLGRRGFNVISQVRRFSRNNREIDRNIDRLCVEFRKLEGGSVDISKDEESGIATVTMCNSGKKNAFTGKMMVDLLDCVTELEQWTAGKGVVLTGADNSFCSGGDLETVKRVLGNGYGMCELMQHTTSRLFDLPMVSCAAISGHALGGGAELATACDFRIMSKEAKIGFVQARLNVATGWGGCTRLAKIVGRTTALQVLASARVLDANTARTLGLVNDVLDTDNIATEAMDWLSKNCIGDVNVTRVIKQMVVAGLYFEESQSYDMEKQLFCKVWGSRSHKDALEANIKHK
ncbi:ECHD1-like protein [Mya arenaria]|uniref:ECHD1-like protein n=1 Tax=Mya arenaria TaxID=6604 RepID=A0ABY7FRU5_MYAAR|nr:ethylmalonyl-CoA decarboxylase-like [Mya arenaria]WAR23436.1 ECHD1-like protein [Mya arenaria]